MQTYAIAHGRVAVYPIFIEIHFMGWGWESTLTVKSRYEYEYNSTNYAIFYNFVVTFKIVYVSQVEKMKIRKQNSKESIRS
jgi:hypothetical protein